MAGAGAGGFLADVYGRKLILMAFHVPFVVSWVMIAVADNVYWIIAARCLSGLADGALLALLPVYITEISRVKSRGKN